MMGLRNRIVVFVEYKLVGTKLRGKIAVPFFLIFIFYALV